MKKQQLLLFGTILLTIFILNSCKREIPEQPPAEACFSTTKATYTTFENVGIINCSQNAKSYSWDFGDGHVSNEAVPTYQYQKDGNYTITLTAIGEGSTSNFSKSVTITKIPPTSCFSTLYTTYEVDENVTFTNCSQNAETYSWNFGDGATSTEQSPMHSYNTVGNYTISLTTTGNGLTNTVSHSISIVMTPPTSCFTTQFSSYEINESVTFSNCSQNAVSYNWDFGDGNTSTATNPTHTYPNEGNYTIQLTSTANNGLTNTISKSLSITKTPPTACFTTQYDVYTVNENVVFNNCSQNATSYLWNFGDGTTSNLQNPIHTYTSTGNYSVSLTTTAYDLTDVVTKNLSVILGPAACFTTQYDDYYIDEEVVFTNCSSDATSYLWDFGDGTTSTLQNPAHTYTNTGNYTVTLKAYSNGIESTVTKDLAVHYTTDLDILVMYDGSSDPVIDAEVTLYETENDWINDTNPYLWGNTDNNGIIIFENLDPVEYYVYAYKEASTPPDYYGNDNQGNLVGPLIQYELNSYNVYVEFIYGKNGKKNAYIIKKIKRVKTRNKRRTNNIVKLKRKR